MLYAKARALIADIKKMKFSYTPESVPDDVLLSLVLYQLPFFYALVKRMNTMSSAIIKLVRATGDSSNTITKAANITPILAFTFSVIDFLEIPLIYIAAYSLNAKLPDMTLSTLAKWLYSSILLSLYIIAILKPTTVPIITVAATSIVFVMSVATLGKIYLYYYQNKNVLKNVIEQIAKSPVSQLHQCAVELENACRVKNDQLVNELMEKIELLMSDCEKQKTEINALYQKKYKLEESLKIESAVMENCVAIVLTSLALIGAVVSLFLTTIGQGILITVSLVGSTFAITQLISPYVKRLGNWISRNQYGPVPQEDVLDIRNIHESTLNIIKPLTKNITPQNTQAPAIIKDDKHSDKPAVQDDNNINLTNSRSISPLKWPDKTTFENKFSMELKNTKHSFKIEPNQGGYTIKSFKKQLEIREHELMVTRKGKIAASVALVYKPTDKELLAEKMVAAYIAAGNDRTEAVKIQCADPELNRALQVALERKHLTPIFTGHLSRNKPDRSD